MANAAQQMPEHVGTAYKDAVDNIIFLKRQQWLATNYALLVYAAIFVISAHYFSRTDLARNWLGVLTIVRLLYTGACCTYFNARSRSLESPGLDLQDLLQRGGACWIGCTAGTKIILVSTGALHWPHSCLIRRSCLDCGLFVVSPLTF